MSVRTWRYALASTVGISHVKVGTPCQDASECRILQASDGSSVLVAVVSDGAGSASRSEIGAKLACSLIIRRMSALLEGGGRLQDITREVMESWIANFQGEVLVLAEAESRTPRDFACTILSA